MNAAPSSIVIREVASIAEMREVERLQREVWGVADLDIFPALALRPQKDVGAILIGAFSAQKMVGFVFGFPGIHGIHGGETIIHSDMLAVSPEFRSYGLGYLLKLAQRDKAIEMGINKITWTYDPLQLLNANLNFGKLGVIADRYDIDYYGETSSFLHNFGTDRLWVTWMLQSERVEDRIKEASVPKHLNELAQQIPAMVRVGADDEPVSVETPFVGSLSIQIPADINRLNQEGSGKAQRWREATRAAFTKAIEYGYTVREFVVTDGASNRFGSYLLNPKTAETQRSES
jgi:predicted GNAT superfamily acetyltransferase